MVRTLERAFAEAASFPEETQEAIGRQWLAYLEQLRELRASLDEAARELDAGEGRELDIDEFLKEMRRQHGKA
jgi:Arc/MetJ-type ribon-helix-helix transcriptional regulator